MTELTVEEAIGILRERGCDIEEQTILLMNQKAYRVNGVYRFGDWLISGMCRDTTGSRRMRVMGAVS